MAKNLRVGCQAPYRLARDVTQSAKSLSRVCPARVVWLGLHPTSVLVPGDRVEIDLAPVLRAHGETHWPQVLANRESDLLQRADGGSGVSHGDDQVEVFVRSGLPPDQRIDAPPAVQPTRNSRVGQEVKDGDDISGFHMPLITPLHAIVAGGWLVTGGRVGHAP
jgi:hypothetical protein